MRENVRPNIVLFMTDQQRGDCLGVAGHPVLQTPHIDELAGRGSYFPHAYSACPLCIPARRTLMTGTRPVTHRVLGNVDLEFDLPTLPGALRSAGYQTHVVGKMHLYPKRKRYGFDSMVWSDGPYEGKDIGDYGPFLLAGAPGMPLPAVAHGATLNSWVARPWHLDDRLHFTNWVTDNAIEFLQRRDPTCPFFLKVSYFHPHQPVACPAFYYNRYANMELPPQVCGQWAQKYERPQAGLPVRAREGYLNEQLSHQFRAGYYGCINHIDDQVGRILDVLNPDTVGRETLFVFASDHGEMLGDHQIIGKRAPFEPSARIPLVIKFPESMGFRFGQVHANVVELMDIMPTLLESAGVQVPASVEGRSLLPLAADEPVAWRTYIHGECAHISEQAPKADAAMQYLTDGLRKLAWFPLRDQQLFFNLEDDPQEMHNLIDEPAYAREIGVWRDRLVHELSGRPEGFVRAGALARPQQMYPVLPESM